MKPVRALLLATSTSLLALFTGQSLAQPGLPPDAAPGGAWPQRCDAFSRTGSQSDGSRRGQHLDAHAQRRERQPDVQRPVLPPLLRRAGTAAGAQASGSGVIVDAAKGYVLTNHHVW